MTRRKPITVTTSPDFEPGAPFNKPGRSCVVGCCYRGDPQNVHEASKVHGQSVARNLAPNYEASAPGQNVRCKPMPHFDALVAEAERVGWPRDYRADLYVHDRRMLDWHDPSEPFLWVLRDNGTHVEMASHRPIGRGGNGRPQYAWDAPKFIEHAFGSDPARVRFYTWDGRDLRHHRTVDTCIEAVRYLSDRYEAEKRSAA